MNLDPYLEEHGIRIEIPRLDIDQLMAATPELTFDTSNFNSEQNELMGKFKQQLQLVYENRDLIYFLSERGICRKTDNFLLEISNTKKDPNPIEALKRCINACVSYRRITRI